MHSSKLRDAYYFILFHDKVAIQQKYNLLTTHIIYFSTGQSFIGYQPFYLVTLDNRVGYPKFLTNGIR
jgi:hypothetical protein